MGIKDKRKLSGLLMSKSLSCSTPLFHPCQNPPPYPLYNADKYCKMSLSGGLAQLVKQRTLKCYVIKDCYEG